MTTCSVKIFEENFIDRLANEVLDFTDAFDGKCTQLIKLANGLNINIYNANFKDNDIAGMLKIENNEYNIYVNSMQPTVRQRFTVAHEIAHFLLHKNLIDDQKGNVLYRKDFNSSSTIEQQANSLAAALLMPKEQILKAWENLRDVAEIAEIFETSNEATYIRLNKLGALNG